MSSNTTTKKKVYSKPAIVTGPKLGAITAVQVTSGNKF